MGKQYGVVRIILSFVAWDAVGNSNWYILAILYLYLLVLFGGKILRAHGDTLTAVVLAGCLIYIVVMLKTGKGSWYYDTILCYPMGMMFGDHKQSIDRYLGSKTRYICALIAVITLFIGSYALTNICGILGFGFSLIKGNFFALTIAILSMKLQIGNVVLDWLGKYVFEIYILQRLPMMALKGIISNTYLYFAVCFSITVILAIVFKIGADYCLKMEKDRSGKRRAK